MPSFLTSALDGGEWSASCLGRFTPGEIIPGTYEAGWVPEPVWTLCRGEKYHVQAGIRTPAVEPVACRYTD
jgi:hypothetical protein